MNTIFAGWGRKGEEPNIQIALGLPRWSIRDWIYPTAKTV